MPLLKLAERAAAKFPLRMAELFSSITPLIPVYHTVSGERLPHICHLYHHKNERQFVSDIDFLCRRYRPVSLPEVIAHVRGGKELPKKSFLLTFDDGYREIFSTVAPILYQKGVPAVFFLVTDFIDNKALSYRNKISLLIEYISTHEEAYRQIRPRLPDFLNHPLPELLREIRRVRYQDARVLDEMAALLDLDFQAYMTAVKPFLSSEQIFQMIEMGFSFGAHSLDHPRYADLNLIEQFRQTLGSLEILRKTYRLPFSVFAFPNNDTSVTREFFAGIADHVDLTFGTSGPRTDVIRSNLQRIDFEKTLEPAKDILARGYVQKSIFQWIGRSEIRRV